MKLLQAMILAAVVLDATLVLTSTITPAANAEQVTQNESTLGPNAALISR